MHKYMPIECLVKKLKYVKRIQTFMIQLKLYQFHCLANESKKFFKLMEKYSDVDFKECRWHFK